MAVEAHRLATHAECGSNREGSECGSGALGVLSLLKASDGYVGTFTW